MLYARAKTDDLQYYIWVDRLLPAAEAPGIAFCEQVSRQTNGPFDVTLLPDGSSDRKIRID